MVKNLRAVQETQVQSLDWEDALEWGMATHSSILAWRIPRTRGAWLAVVHGGHKESETTEVTKQQQQHTSVKPSSQTRH